MNLHIATAENGEIKRYSLDFQPWEYHVALETIKNLTPISKPLNIKNEIDKEPSLSSTQEPIIAVKENVIHVAAKTPRIKSKKEAFNISNETLSTVSALLRPSVRKAFKSIDLSYANYANMRTHRRVSKQTWDKIANSFDIKYTIEEGSICVKPIVLPKFIAEDESVTQSEQVSQTDNTQGIFVSYKSGMAVINKWTTGETIKSMQKKLEITNRKKSLTAGYPTTFKILEIKEMTYGEYQNLEADTVSKN